MKFLNHRQLSLIEFLPKLIPPWNFRPVFSILNVLILFIFSENRLEPELCEENVLRQASILKVIKMESLRPLLTPLLVKEECFNKFFTDFDFLDGKFYTTLTYTNENCVNCKCKACHFRWLRKIFIEQGIRSWNHCWINFR